MAKKTDTQVVQTEQGAIPLTTDVLLQLVQAIQANAEATNGPRKKTIVTRKQNSPWTPKDGSPKLKLKRKMYQHGIAMDPDMLSNEEIELLNKIKPGRYCDGDIIVERRRDKGINLTYPHTTASQRLRVLNDRGLTTIPAICQRIIAESENPKQYSRPEDLDE